MAHKCLVFDINKGFRRAHLQFKKKSMYMRYHTTFDLVGTLTYSNYKVLFKTVFIQISLLAFYENS